MKTILITTDQPFWRRENGAQQRTWSIVQFLLASGFEVTVFFLVPMTPSDVVTCGKHGLRIVLFDPREIRTRDRIVFGVGRLIRGVRLWFRGGSPASQTAALTLESYHWPLAVLQFRSLVESLRPDFVYSVYVVWSHLLDGVADRKRCFRAIVDTHDLLHQRQQEFTRRGHRHWISVSKDEEVAALQNFDLILATQAEEAESIREMVPRREVIVVGYLPGNGAGIRRTNRGTPQKNRPWRFAFIASDNAANFDGILWFLNECWDEIFRLTQAELVIAGDVADVLRREMPADRRGVRCLGKVLSLEDFYAEIDIAINPVHFGSGVKIKSIEAIGFGKPLVTHSHNTRGLSEGAVDAMILADESATFTNACVRLVRDDVWRNEVMDRCERFCETELSSESVYSGLLQWLQTSDGTDDVRT
ncbi:glycosyltransferase [Aporhodopirellula aestuarii]|uniref:Glycosyltransferase n=1 Tax=Aporhodopirellula aestuarii TaxID=2950107 RepID=A0ABT0U090_9BACT|nr:glycosyltransferase [Aporhodopirellula aestuarii]MCM2370257.1 glycosyltransferase [Aporhodopirellula aestuarii]